MRQPLVYADGRIHGLKLLVYSLAFSVSLAAFIVWVEQASNWAYAYAGMLSAGVYFLGCLQLIVLTLHEIQGLLNRIKSVIVKLLLAHPPLRVKAFWSTNMQLSGGRLPSPVCIHTQCVMRC